MKRLLATLPLLLACTAPAWAGSAEVRFVNPQAYSDDGASPREREAARDALTRELKKLATRLPAGQVLAVDLLDIRLAGSSRPRPDGREWRVLHGGADYPVLKLRWSVAQDGRTLSSGEERLADVDYARGLPHAADRGQPFYYERRMLQRWFGAHFGDGTGAGAPAG